MSVRAAVRRSGAAPTLASGRGWAWLVAMVAAGLLLPGGIDVASAASSRNETPAGLLRAARAPAAPSAFKVCEDQTYALCATASCFVFDEVAYCKCDVEHGDSISLPFDFDDGQDVCTANAEGVDNGYMISTFSLPASVLAPDGDQALYTCPAGVSDGAYAQCDGGFCFTSSQGQSFPGFDQPLEEGEIICSCPITVANPQTARVGFQIAGPYPCQRSFFENCKNPPAGTQTGATIYAGAPTGTARFLTRQLYGSVPPLHECPAPRNLGAGPEHPRR
jgi:hypothetical protein